MFVVKNAYKTNIYVYKFVINFLLFMNLYKMYEEICLRNIIFL